VFSFYKVLLWEQTNIKYEILTAVLMKIKAHATLKSQQLFTSRHGLKTRRLVAFYGLNCYFVLRSISRKTKQIYLYLNHPAWKVNGLIEHILYCYIKCHKYYTHEIVSIIHMLLKPISILLPDYTEINFLRTASTKFS
jgi:hypothetical protein